MTLFRVVPCAVFLFFGSALFGQRLISQQVEGLSRICVYERQGPIAEQNVALRVGLGQPCPERMPLAEDPRDDSIPFMAQLAREAVSGGRRICTYSYAGRDYPRSVDLSLRCPLSPRYLEPATQAGTGR